MKMIDVLCKLANGEIKEGTKLIIGGYMFDYVKRWLSETSVSYRFEYGKGKTLEDYYDIDINFLNKEVGLIPPEEKKYLVKFNMRGWKEHFRYLNYYKKNDSIEINSKRCTDSAKTHFTKDELQSIQPVREFLEDMQGKFELVEVEDNEID